MSCITVSLLAVGVRVARSVIGFSHRSFEEGLRLQLERINSSAGAKR